MLARTNIPLKGHKLKRYEKAENCILGLFPIFSRWVPLIQFITLTLKMTIAQVVETSVTLTNSSFQNYIHPDDHTRETTL